MKRLLERLLERIGWMGAFVSIALLSTTAFGVEVTQFRHFTGYTRTHIEIVMDEATTITVALLEGATTQTVGTYTDYGTNVSKTVTGLNYGSGYGVAYKLHGGEWQKPDDTGYYLKTLDRWHFTRMAFDKSDGAIVFFRAIDNVVPDQKMAILDEVERLTRTALKSVKDEKRTAEDKVWDVIE